MGARPSVNAEYIEEVPYAPPQMTMDEFMGKIGAKENFISETIVKERGISDEKRKISSKKNIWSYLRSIFR